MTSCRFKDKAIYGYGTSIPPNNNEDEESHCDMPPRKVIFCVHGKLSGCCTVVKSSVDDNATADYQQNPTSMFSRGSRFDSTDIFKRKL